MPLGIILLVVVGGIAFFVMTTYNGLQTLKTQIAASIQEIGNQLKRQASLIPNLQESVKAYMGHEKGVFQMLTDARTSVTKANASSSAKDIDQAIQKIQSVIPAINVMVESNPELKADSTVTKFMDELSDTSDKLMYARRSLIDLSQDYNARLLVFPSNIIANMFGFKPAAGLATPTTGAHVEVSETELSDPKVKLS